MRQSVRVWFLPVFGLIAWLLAGFATAGEEWLVRGETKTVDGQIPVVFWMDEAHTRYQKLPDNVKPEILLQGARLVGVPQGWKVEPVKVEVKVETRSRSQSVGVGRSSASWDAYVLSGTWKVTVPKESPEGEYNLAVTFPEVEGYSDEFGALNVPTSIPLKIKVFATADARFKEDLNENASSIYVVVAILVAATVLIGGVIVWWKYIRS
jgi:hypothetical protein